MKVTKEVTFDSAHMLSNYHGKCENLHGHTYKLQVSIEAIQQLEGNEEGMVVDFNTLKKAIDGVIESFDHSIIFSDEEHRSEAENELLKWADTHGMSYVVIIGKSTSENIATYIKAMISTVFSTLPVYAIGVRLWETPTSFAEV